MKIVDIHNELHKQIERAIQQDRQAQKVLYQRYAPKLLSVCRQYIQDIHAAEDMLVTSFMKILTNLHRFEYKGSFEAWMRRITVNECISYIRKNKKVQYTDQIEVSSEMREVDSLLFEADIQDIIDGLPTGCKMVFIMFVVEGYKHEEIAEILHISEGTSKSQLAYARKLLQQMLLQNNIANHG